MQNVSELSRPAKFPGPSGKPPFTCPEVEFSGRPLGITNHQPLSPEQAFAQALEYMGADTAAHSVRMTNIALRFARHLGLAAEDQAALKIASYFHDIGKGAIEDRILQKKGPLTKKETNIIRNHPAIGETMAAYLGLGIREGLILHHHERWDGKGYPYGLAGNDIPFLSQIMFLADSYDALTSNRPYRAGCKAEKALTEIRNCGGTQFNSELTLEFLAMFYVSTSAIAKRGSHGQQSSCALDCRRTDLHF